MPRIVVGLTGRAGSGKTTFAGLFANALRRRGLTPTVVAFADALRDVVEACFGSRFETQTEKAVVLPFWRERLGHDFATGRRILQRVGTELFRGHVHPDFWCWVFESRHAGADVDAGPLIVSDVRFDNEAATIRRMGGTVWRLARPEADAAPVVHASERGVRDDLVAGLLDNSGSLVQLIDEAEHLARLLVPGF